MEGESVLDEAREQYLTLLLEQFESGTLEAYEYTRRVRAIELAATADQMADIVSSAPATEPVLDPVDLMNMARTANTMAGPKRVRFWWPALLAFFLVVLLVVGLWLVAHVHSLRNSGTGVVTGVVVVGSGQPWSPTSPGLSPRR